jgi:glycosyltransferase involved in cell wall biosynthesis
VTFAGEVVDDALETLWQGADVFALASHWEGYGMAIAEALKRGVPVAVTAVGIAPTLVTPENGIMVQPATRTLLSKALRRVIFGAGLRHDMAEAAWQSGRACRHGMSNRAPSPRALLLQRTERDVMHADRPTGD